MRKITSFIVISLFAAVLFLLPMPSAAEEKVSDFTAEIILNHDSSFTVNEIITYDFGELEKHGIYRDIPYHYRRSGSSYNVRIKVISVTDKNGLAWPYSQSRLGGLLKLKIGDADQYVSGVQTYQISYRVERAINYFDDQDEFYWNITGNEWPVGFDNVSAEITLPQTADEGEIRLACYTGVTGSPASDCTTDYIDSTVATASSQPLLAGEGLTLVVGLPKGMLVKPEMSQQIIWWLTDNWVVMIPVFGFLFMFFMWWTRGRDPKVIETLVPQYESPQYMPAGEIGVIIDEKADIRDISATIIQLAVKGFLKIKETKSPGLLKDKHDYELHQLKDADGSLKGYEKEIFKGIFDSGKMRTMASMKNKFYVHLKEIKKQMYELVVDDGFFPTNPEKVRNIYRSMAIFVLLIGVYLVFNVFSIFNFLLIITGVIGLIFSGFMPRRTKLGAETKVYILGFEWFLKVTETERLKFHNAPAKSPQQFEKLLPYAMVLNVEKEWAKQFIGIDQILPSWFEGQPGTVFTAIYLTSALNSFSSSVNQSMVSAPSKSSTAGFGGSGFGGGGFSGGGFGGGGGGSW